MGLTSEETQIRTLKTASGDTVQDGSFTPDIYSTDLFLYFLLSDEAETELLQPKEAKH